MPVPGPVIAAIDGVAPAGADDDLGRVVGPGEVENRLRDAIADDGVVAAAERLDQQPLLLQGGEAGSGQTVAAGDVDGQQFTAGGAGGDPGGAADQRLALGAAGERDDDALACLPGRGDAVLLAVALQPLVDAVGQPQQGQLAQRGEVAGPEVVAQRGVDLVGLVDVAVRHPPAQRLGGHVDEFDLLGGADDRVGHGFALRDAGDRLARRR